MFKIVLVVLTSLVYSTTWAEQRKLTKIKSLSVNELHRIAFGHDYDVLLFMANGLLTIIIPKASGKVV